MLNNTYGSKPYKKYGQSSFGGNSPRGGSSSRGGSRGFGSGSRSNFGGRSGSRFSRGRAIDINKFVNKDVKPVQEDNYIQENKFSDFAVSDRLKSAIKQRGYIDPMPIQDKTIPTILEGKDLVGIANTGTGKTAAFLIPLIDKVLRDRNQKVLILAPTRELAQQIESEFKYFGKQLGLWSATCVGGLNIRIQMNNIRKGASFVIATPGRLMDLQERRAIDLNKFSTVVVDEVDRMFDMGFIQDIKQILGSLAKPRQSLFFSATMTPQINQLIRDNSNNPVNVSVKTRDTSANVYQDIVRVSNYAHKIEKLHELLGQAEFKKVLIFIETKRGVHELHLKLEEKGFRVDSLHGDKTQFKRQHAIAQFKSNEVNILVATDVAARGLDIPNVTHVINFDVPQSYEDYVHRIGRTGRANSRGIALTFVA